MMIYIDVITGIGGGDGGAGLSIFYSLFLLYKIYF